MLSMLKVKEYIIFIPDSIPALINYWILKTMSTKEKQYIVGLGCRRGVKCCEIEEAVLSVLNAYDLKLENICEIVSCDLKSDEIGLLEFAEKIKLPIRFFPLEKLSGISVPNPSAKVIEKIGSPSVSEAAAKFAGNGILTVEKQKIGNITVAVGETLK